MTNHSSAFDSQQPASNANRDPLQLAGAPTYSRPTPRRVVLGNGAETKPSFNKPSSAAHSSGFKKPSSHIPKGHDAILKRFQDEKTKMQFELLNDEILVGTISGRDKFTISVCVEEGYAPATIYKSAIAVFMPYETAKLIDEKR